MVCACPLFLTTACGEPAATASFEAEPSASAQYQNGFEEYERPSVEDLGKFIQTPSVRDYAHMWWQDGFNKGERAMLFQTGYYGMKVNILKASLTNLGVINEVITESAAMTQEPERIKTMPAVSMSYSLEQEGEEFPFSYVQPVDGVGSRIIESGRYMQSMDIMSLRFKGMADAVSGRVEIKAQPRYFSLHFSVHTSEKMPQTGMSFKLNMTEEYSIMEQSGDGRVIILRSAEGDGLAALLPEREDVSARLEGTSMIFECAPMEMELNEFNGFGIIFLPLSGQSLAQAEAERAGMFALDIEAEQLAPREGREHEVTLDSERGLYVIDISGMSSGRTTDFAVEKRRNDYDRLRFTIKNNSGQTVKAALLFSKEKGEFGVEGMAGMLRDVQTGEPIGVQVQTSKNWHKYGSDIAQNDVKRYLEGTWYHGYTLLEVPAGEEVSYELTIAYSQWGETYSASHAQLCLAGWGGNLQKWETSALGSSGENMCYDAEMAHATGAFINDALPFATLGGIDGSGMKYNWSNGASGGNFLVYYNQSGSRVGLKSVRTWFKKQGPNLTEVIYTGVTDDGAIQVEYKVNLGRSNDFAKNTHTFSYTFLKDVSFSRLAYYSIGSDDYNTGLWRELAVGNLEGLCDFTIGDTLYNGIITPEYPQSGQYIGGGDMQRIEIEGEGLWVAMSKAEVITERYGTPSNRMLNLLEFSGSINGREYAKPALNLRYTHQYDGYNQVNVYSISAELGPSEDVGNKIEAGSRVTGVVQYINLPNFKDWYYGGNQTLESLPEEMFDSWKLAHFIAQGEHFEASASVGRIIQNYPLIVETAAGGEAAYISIKGGLGYVPVTFTGLNSYSGYSLMKKTEDGYELVDQSVHGSDYWQTWFDSEKGAYELTFNVLHSGEPEQIYEYKLIKD